MKTYSTLQVSVTRTLITLKRWAEHVSHTTHRVLFFLALFAFIIPKLRPELSNHLIEKAIHTIEIFVLYTTGALILLIPAIKAFTYHPLAHLSLLLPGWSTAPFSTYFIPLEERSLDCGNLAAQIADLTALWYIAFGICGHDKPRTRRRLYMRWAKKNPDIFKFYYWNGKMVGFLIEMPMVKGQQECQHYKGETRITELSENEILYRGRKSLRVHLQAFWIEPFFREGEYIQQIARSIMKTAASLISINGKQGRYNKNAILYSECFTVDGTTFLKRLGFHITNNRSAMGFHIAEFSLDPNSEIPEDVDVKARMETLSYLKSVFPA